jgi:hypothetical protein
MSESVRGHSPTRSSMSQLASEGRIHLHAVSLFHCSTESSGRKICASSGPARPQTSILPCNMGRLPFLLHLVQIADIFWANVNSQWLFACDIDATSYFAKPMPQKRFRTVRAPRTTSRTSNLPGLTVEDTAVERTATNTGTARITTSSNQNLCQSTSLCCM